MMAIAGKTIQRPIDSYESWDAVQTTVTIPFELAAVIR